MILCVGSTDKTQVITSASGTVDVHVSGMDVVDATGVVSTYRKNTAITTATTTDISAAPSAGTTRNIKTINIRNKHATSSVDVTVQHTDGTTVSELFKTTLLAGETLGYVEGIGFVHLTASSPILGGVGTPATAAQSLSVAANVVNGTLIQLPTSNLKVGSRFRIHIGVDKTAAGTATWAVALKWGTAGTTSDAAVASWTSGTNTAAIDQATIDIEAVVATLGASATMNCIAFYVNTLTNVTGLGKISFNPSSTASFDSTAANPFLHVDITPGASAVMTSIASVERLA